MNALNMARPMHRMGGRIVTLCSRPRRESRFISQARNPQFAYIEAEREGSSSGQLQGRSIVPDHASPQNDTPYRLIIKGPANGSSQPHTLGGSRLRQSPGQSQEGKEEAFAVPNLWLRENCQCAQCIHPATRQREVDIFSSSQAPSINEASDDGKTIKVSWSDGHQSIYTQEWFQKAGRLTQVHKELQQLPDRKFITWSQATFGTAGLPSVAYKDIMQTSEGLKSWLLRLRKYGFCFVDGCPVDPEATRGLLEKIGPIRNTHYGAFYDFTSDLSSKDTAYTQQGLGLHTDTTYFSEPAGLQMFHMLSHTDGEGGASTLADGFAAAQELKRQDEEAYDILSRLKFVWHASGNDDISIVPNTPAPVLSHDEVTGALEQVRWNNADRGTLDLVLADVIANGAEKWYEAARMFDAILKEHLVQVQMQPGRPLIFDNWRVLHGRTAFTGKRRVAGGYISRDDFMSRYKMSVWGPEEVLRAPIV